MPRIKLFYAHWVLGLAVVGLAGTVGAAPKQKTEGDVVARIGDQAITLSEVDASARAADMAAYQALYDARKAALDSMVNEKLVALEAKARGVSADQLIQTEITAKMQPVGDADVENYFNQNKERMRGQTLEQIGPEIRKFLAGQTTATAQDGFYRELRKKHAVQVLLDPPRATVEVAAEDPHKGPAGAVVQIVEFSDFQCPYCSKVGPTLDKVVEKYGDKIQIVFRDFPLGFHQQAPKAAEAAQCANEQNRFWEYHDKLFANQRALLPDNLKTYAVEVGLDGGAFNECLDSGRFTAEVNTDMEQGSSYGVRGTPAFFINGRFLSGAQPYEAFEKIIEEELQLKGSGKS